MSGIAFAIPGDLTLPTGGYGYDRRLLAEWRAMGVAAHHLALPGTFPAPDAASIAQTAHSLETLPSNVTILVDGLAYGAFPEDLASRFGQRIVALVHHPLALETGLTEQRAAALQVSETRALRHARGVIVTSPATKRLLVADFGVAADRIAVAVPGVDAAARARGGVTGAPLNLLAVGSLVPRKGYAGMIEALAPLAHRPWRLTIIGADDRAPDTTADLKARIAAAGLQDRILLAGAVDQTVLAEAYDRCDLFLMPSLFEGYGMVLTEALARGLPILCTTGGAAADTVPDAAAVKVPPGDAAALHAALVTLLDNASRLSEMADAAWAAAAGLPRWHDTAAIVAQACLPERVAPAGWKVME